MTLMPWAYREPEPQDLNRGCDSWTKSCHDQFDHLFAADVRRTTQSLPGKSQKRHQPAAEALAAAITDEVIAIAQEAGFMISCEDLKSTQSSKTLSDDDIEAAAVAAGGALIILMTAIHIPTQMSYAC